MAFADELLAARNGAASLFHEFLNAYNPLNRKIHCFFEGQDDPSFYVNYLNRKKLAGWSLALYRCNSKKAVYEIYMKISRQHTQPGECLFFVDKDLSEYTGEIYPLSQQIFVTECYSTENYIVCDAILERIWVELYHQDGTTEELSLILMTFKKQLANFYRLILIIMAWSIYMKRIGKPPVLNSLDLAKICQFDRDMKLSRKISASRLQSHLDIVCQVKTPPRIMKHIRAIIKMLLVRNPKTYVRGKFELWFFVQFLKKLEEHCRELANSLGRPFNYRTSISQKNALEVLGPRLELPKTLQDFLDSNMGKLQALESQLTLPTLGTN